MTGCLGIIGAGGIGRLHAEAATAAGVRVAGVCDADLDRAQTLAQRHPGAVATDSLEALLALDAVLAVVVATPNYLHRQQATAALRAGKDVLLEKPMALTVTECDAIAAAMEESGRLVQVGFVCRFAPSITIVRRLLAEGRLGRIEHVQASIIRRRGIPGLGRWFTTRAQSGGGVLIDLGVHLIDLALHLLGSPTPARVSAHCSSTFGSPIASYQYEEMWAGPPDPQGTFDVEDAAAALIRFADGRTMTLDAAWAANAPAEGRPDGLMLLGDRGGCFCDPWGDRVLFTSQTEDGLADEMMAVDVDDPWTEAWRLEHESFARCVRERRAPAASVADGRVVQAVIDAMYQSSETGCEVQVNL